MLRTRILVSLLLLPVGIAAVVIGGFPYYLLIAFVLALAAWEYVILFRSGGFQPAGGFVIFGVLALAVGRAWNDFESAPPLLSFLILAAMVAHLAAFERGAERSGTDYGITLGGILYLGWIGAYLISMRKLPYGEWWLLLVLPAIWAADSGAYFAGRTFGRHRMSPRTSPKKTWEGFVGGVVFATLFGGLLGHLYQTYAVPGSEITLASGLALGLILSLTSVFGDLGESMFKRQVGVKDSGNLLPGHGGVFDRIDSWLWGGVVGFYVIQVLLHLG
jgi:phosphatidate cytidylyltransferase